MTGRVGKIDISFFLYKISFFLFRLVKLNFIGIIATEPSFTCTIVRLYEGLRYSGTYRVHYHPPSRGFTILWYLLSLLVSSGFTRFYYIVVLTEFTVIVTLQIFTSIDRGLNGKSLAPEDLFSFICCKGAIMAKAELL